MTFRTHAVLQNSTFATSWGDISARVSCTLALTGGPVRDVDTTISDRTIISSDHELGLQYLNSDGDQVSVVIPLDLTMCTALSEAVDCAREDLERRGGGEPDGSVPS